MPLIWIPFAFAVVALVAPSQRYHWDTLERAYLVDHAGDYLRTWDGSPRSQFLSFAHVLELPLAKVVQWVLPGANGLRALCVLEVLAGAALLVLLGGLVRAWRRQTRAGTPRDALVAACGAQLTIAVAIAFWRMSSSGEEKILALMTQWAFLGAFWAALWRLAPPSAAEHPRAAKGTRDLRDAHAAQRAGTLVAITLALAILSHLTAAVLVPFAIAAIAWLPPSLHPARKPLARAVTIGTVAAFLLYSVVAAWTTHVRTPREFYDYLTFFHRAGGIDFFAPANAPMTSGERLDAVFAGLGAFFAAPTWAWRSTLIALAIALIATTWWWRRRTAATAAGSGLARRVLARHAVVLIVLWTAHFAFFEPANQESWTLVATVAVVWAAVLLPGRTAWALAAIPVVLFFANRTSYAAARTPLPYAAFVHVIAQQTRPGDVVLLVGGVQDGQALRGSLGMRYFLAVGPEREYASLYDIIGVTGREYWPTPFTSPAALQAAIDAGRRVLAPAFLQSDIDFANRSGIVRIESEAASDSLLRITRIAAVEAP